MATRVRTSLARASAGAVVALAVAGALSGCSQPDDHCDVGLAAGLTLTVEYSSRAEPGLQVCFDGHCSRVFTPTLPNGGGYDDFVQVAHRGPGEWLVDFRKDAPTDPTVRFYEGAERVQTSTLHLRRPRIDPCSTTSFPPAPHPTISIDPR